MRCASCQMDHNRSASACSNCGADLRTDEQRAFNARLAEERRAQATAEGTQVAELERAQREARGFGAPPGRGGWGPGSWDDPGGGTWGSGRHGAMGLGGWLLAMLLRFLFGGRRWR